MMSLAVADTPVKPVWPNVDITPEVWIDASDFAVGSLADGATISNKGNAGFNFLVSGTGLSVAVNAEGKKAFVFTGAQSIKCPSANIDFFQHLHDITASYAILFIGKIGTTSNPDAVYGICGNNAASSLNKGIYMLAENRVSQPTTKGLQYAIARAVSNVWHTRTIKYTSSLKYGTRTAIHSALNFSLLKDYNRLYVDGELYAVNDATRSTANTTSGLGGVVSANTQDPSYDFQIGACGNNVGYLTGEIEQFVIIQTPGSAYTLDTARGLEKWFKHFVPRGHTDCKYIKHTQTLSDQYVLGGWYHKKTDKSKTTWLTSKGADHFTPGTDRTGVQVVSNNDGWSFPSSYSNVIVDASTSPHNGMGGGILPSGKAIVVYGKYTSATGAYTDMVYRTSNDMETWSSETSITLPTTSPALTSYVTHDIGVLADNGDMLIPWYAVSGSSLYNVYVMRVSSDGTVFSHKLIYTSGSTYKNEVSIARISSAGSSSKWIAAVRVEGSANTGGTYVHEFFKSTDDCETWSSLGTSSYGGRMYVYPHPPMIRTFLLNGVLVMAFYFVDRGDRRWWVMYVTASDFDTNGVSALNNTLYQLDIRLFGDNQGWESGYPLVIHPDNSLHAEGVYFQETSATVASTTFFKINAEHAGRVAAELGI